MFEINVNRINTIRDLHIEPSDMLKYFAELEDEIVELNEENVKKKKLLGFLIYKFLL